MKTKAFIAFFITLLAAGGCTKQHINVVPSGYSELYGTYLKGLQFEEVDFSTDRAVITFEDASLVTLRLDEVAVHDCSGYSPGITAWNSDGEWMLNGKNLGIWREDVPDALAVPIYIYIKDDKINVLLSNEGQYSIGMHLDELPVIYLYTDGNAQITSKEDYVAGTFRMGETSARMRIRGRGNSTWTMPKKSWKLKFDSKISLMGLAEDKEWCLLANYADKSLIRNLTAMQISRVCNMSWTPKMQNCEVYLNNNYQGVYTLSEHKKVSKNRVNIDTGKGDILFEIDQDQDENVCWMTPLGTPVMFSDPDEPTAAQEQDAKKIFEDIEAALVKGEYSKVYTLIDMDSFINAYIVQELTMNIDGNFRKSSYLTLPKDGKLEYFFVWDFDLSLGNADYFGNPPGNGPEGWWVKDYGSAGYGKSWYCYLFRDAFFKANLKKRWVEVYPDLKKVSNHIDRYYKEIGDEAIARNFAVWSFTDNSWWNASRRTTTYSGELSNLKDFYAKRLVWLNTNINSL